ncbi:inositol-3-phosphate synthase [Saccharothrix longispora]|uniref:Myo-inositol-1-phosphate synthase n=1 Tax=Saccharothrix longispora TaxID=33920 RepID=A0ABU1PY45_9PSEU|nr:inositol-3-phosphate synthase [Saccharothrix longispora]MDR6595564.1 myo-inositol-1-phosphate synthase [Saccharothrix longispora]
MRRTGLWLIGARGSVATTAVCGLLGLRAGLVPPTGSVTALLDTHVPEGVLPPWDSLVVGGHDVVSTPLAKRAEHLARAGVVPADLLGPIAAGLAEVQAELRDVPQLGPQVEVAARMVADLASFRSRHSLDRVVVVNVASTEPPAPPRPEHADLAALERALSSGEDVLPPSSLAAYAAFKAGCPFVDFTPSTGVTLPALDELAAVVGVPYAGRDGKTGETLVRTVLAPMFTARALRVLSWSGTNLLGGGDGATLEDPDHASSKLRTKASGLAALLGHPVVAPLHIDNVPDLGERKTSWDHVSFEGFLGARMSLQFTWSGLDSALAAPLVLDLARLLAAAHRAGRVGVQGALGFFFKDPLGSTEHGFARQTRDLAEWVEGL